VDILGEQLRESNMKKTVKATKYKGEHWNHVGINEEWDQVPDEFEISWEEPGEHRCEYTPDVARIENRGGEWFYNTMGSLNKDWGAPVRHCPFCGIKL
jgi:hypothetical protein